MAKMHQIRFRLGCSAPDPAGGAHSAPPDPLAGFKGPTSKGRGREGGGKDRRGGKKNPPFKMSAYGPALSVLSCLHDCCYLTTVCSIAYH